MSKELATLPLAARLWLLVATTLVLIPHLTRLPVWLALFGAGVLLWRFARDLRGWGMPPRALRIVITLVVFAAVMATFRRVTGHEAGAALLTMMLSLKFLELRDTRDGIVVVFIAYFLVASNFLFSESLVFGIYMLLTVLALTAALVALTHPGAIFRRWRRYLGTATVMLLQAVPLMLLLFIFLPRIEGPLWGQGEQQSARTGLSEEMSIGDFGRLSQNHEVAFRVKFDNAPPTKDKLYWRGLILWQTDGRTWRMLGGQLGRTSPTPPELLRTGPGDITYTVTLEPHGRHWLFALDLPSSVPEGLDSPIAPRFFPDYQLTAMDNIDETLRYRISSQLSYRTGELEAWEREAAMQLPPGSNPQAFALGQLWASETPDHQTLVQRGLNYIAEQPFWYSRTPPQLGQDPIDEFLFSTRRGFCEHYAGAFVTLMRAAGVPARVVTGYQGGELNALGDYLVVRQSDAHAWAEVWVEGRGWWRVDPTAMIPPHRIEDEGDQARFDETAVGLGLPADAGWLARSLHSLRQSWDALEYQWGQWVLGFGHDKQQQLLKALGLEKLGFRGLLLMLAIGLAVVLGTIVLWMIWHQPRQRDPLLRSYNRFCDKLARHGVERLPQQGPQQLQYQAADTLPHLEQDITEITTLFIDLRYRPPGPQHREQLHQLRQLVRRFPSRPAS